MAERAFVGAGIQAGPQGARRLCGIIAALAVATGMVVGGQSGPEPRSILLLGGTLIDGSGGPPRRNEGILVVGGRIKAMGLDVMRSAPRDARIIEATDQWIVPGLVDGHVHFFQTGGLDARPDFMPDPRGRAYGAVVDGIRRRPQPYLRAYICAGVTSVADLGGPMWGFDLRDSRLDDPLSPRIAFSGPLLGTYDPKPLELEDDDPIWLIKDADDVRAKVERLAARKPDFIKIWFVHRRADARSPKPEAKADDLDAQGALVRSAIDVIHARGLRAAVHATKLNTARISVDAGADILVHSVDDEIDDAFVDAVVRKRVLYVPTLVVSQGYRNVRARQVELDEVDQRCAPRDTVASLSSVPDIPETALPRPAEPPPDPLPGQQRNLKRLADAGAVIVAGTDAGNTGTPHGSSLHRELRLMVEAGLSPRQVLLSATRDGARLMGRERELGQIKEGYLADILVLGGDPLADIRNLRNPAVIIRGGAIYNP